MGRKRKLFTGTTPIGGPTLKSRRVARVVTSKYHKIRNEQAQIDQNSELSTKEKKQRLKELENELVEIGGTNRYQQASIISTQHFKTSRWVLQTLEKLGRKPSDGEKLDVLEVGAINVQLKQCSWLNVRCIDVNSQHPLIEEVDFFNVPANGEYDVVVCSMVVNCVTRPDMRGEMLARLSAQLRPNTGVLLLVLPSRCIDSKHIGGSDKFEELLFGFGLKSLLPQKTTPRLYFYTLGKVFPNNIGANWETSMRQCVASQMSKPVLKQFCKDYSQIPPNEFCVSVPSNLL